MITLSCASPVTSFASETPCGVDPAPAPQPQASSPPTSAQVKPRSLADQAATASRTRLGTVELNASSSSAMPGLGRSRGRSPALKNEVYQPAKRRNDDFNGKVNLAAAEVDDKGMLGGTRVYCRHLAFAYFMTPKKADFLNQVKDQAGIERFFSGGQLRAANQGVKKLRGAANLLNSSVVSAAGLSAQVIDIVQTMARSRQPIADFLITTSNHALAMNIQFKDQGRVCLTTYDPNTTTNHFRVEAKDRNDHATLASIAHCVACYSMLGNHAFTLYAKGNVFRPETALAYRQESGLSTAQKVTAAFICHALDRDDPGLINLLINNAAVENPRGGPGLKAALSATEHGFPGMYAALQNGRAHTVAAWMEGTRKLALNRMLSSNDVYELFKVQGASGGQSNRGLNVAMHAKKPSTIGAFMSQVVETAKAGVLTRAQVKDLFSAPDHSGTPSIDVFWQSGAPKVMAAVVQQLERCFRHNILNAADIKELLMGQGPEMSRTALQGTDRQALETLTGLFGALIACGALRNRDVLELASAHGYVEGERT